MTGTDSKNCTHMARGRSGTVRYELIDKDGYVFGPFESAALAVDLAKATMWARPGAGRGAQRQGMGRTGLWLRSFTVTASEGN